MKLRKEDLAKAIVLVILIIALFAYIIHTLINASRPATSPSTASTEPKPPDSTPQGQMFGSRPPGSGIDLARARSAPDPFRPVALPSLQSDRAAPAAAPQPYEPRQARDIPTPQPPPDAPVFWLTGVVAGTSPLAVVRHGEDRYFVRKGDLLPGDWKVTRIAATRITVSKGARAVDLPITPAPAPARPSGIAPLFAR